MINLQTNIFIGTPHDLQNIIHSINYVFNCSTNLNNLINHPNYINLNINNFSFETLQYLINLSDFIYQKTLLNQNIFILCENGIGSSLIIGMFYIMKCYNLDYNYVYTYISKIYSINHYDFYAGLKYFEPYIIKNTFGEKMDCS